MLTIGCVARQVGVRPSALRYYEAQGILRPAVRGANGYRFYSEDAVNLLLFVRHAQALGIRLKEIKPLQLFRNELRSLLRRKAGLPRADKVCPLIERE